MIFFNAELADYFFSYKSANVYSCHNSHHFCGTNICFNCSNNTPLTLTLMLLILSAIFSTYSISFSFHNTAFSSISLAVYSKLRLLVVFLAHTAANLHYHPTHTSTKTPG